jgi:hypothetical protein
MNQITRLQLTIRFSQASFMAAYLLMCLSSLASQQRIDFAKEKSSFNSQELASYETQQ